MALGADGIGQLRLGRHDGGVGGGVDIERRGRRSEIRRYNCKC